MAMAKIDKQEVEAPTETVNVKKFICKPPRPRLKVVSRYAQRNGWIIHRVERTISASKLNRRKQEEWIICNYENKCQPTLFE